MGEKGGGEFFFGFVIGALAGAAAALLMAPGSGEELRQQLSDQGIALKEQAGKVAGEAKTQAQQLVGDARSQVDHVSERGRIVLSENVKKVQQAVQDAQTKLSTAGETS